jgi:digeranylgeranylglycerophospholipid reductase
MQDITQTDVLIVGGGPAGLLSAKTAAAIGVRTLLIEREEQIGFPVHTSGATALKTVRDFNIPPDLYHIVKSIRICSPNNTVVIEPSKPSGCIIDVQGMYGHLAKQAQNKGATILTGIKAIQPVMSDDSVVGCDAIDSLNKRLRINSKVLIDASGYSADISEKAGLHKGFDRFGVGAEYELIAPNCNQDELVIIVGNRYAPSGYAWAFPWGKGRVRVGVGIIHADSKANPKKHLATFLNEAKLFNINLDGYQIIESHFGLVPADGIAKNFVASGIMVVGDAAGQASLVAGEGIRLSMRAGIIAGETAAKAVLKGRTDRQYLMRYERSFKKAYGKNLKMGYLLNVKMAHWDDAKWDKQVNVLKSVSSDLITKLLQSEFSLIDIASWIAWIAIRPQQWSNALKLTSKLITR